MLHWFRLLRIAGITTLVSNALAMLASTGLDFIDIVKQAAQSGTAFIWVALVSCGVYACGMLWNDIADVSRDAEINPRRPLPSGQVALPTAFIAGCALIALTLVCATQLGWRGFYMAGFLLTCALLYNFGGKHIPWLGSSIMALTRAGHALFALLILGNEHFDLVLLQMSGAFSSGSSSGNIAGYAANQYPLFLGLYIFAITLISELEHRRSYRWELLIGSGLLLSALALVIWQVATSVLLRDFIVERQATQATLLIIAMIGGSIWAVGRLASILVPAIVHARRALIGVFMVRGLSGIILFDVLVVLAFLPLLALPMLLLLPIFKILGRMGRMD
ncbi:MAG: hypothetical protein EA401_11340 [Planctomycetota bacterium]|nr:MAG: hypothetical protein EA401_11340 [Planctomycetota bacterium]